MKKGTSNYFQDIDTSWDTGHVSFSFSQRVYDGLRLAEPLDRWLGLDQLLCLLLSEVLGDEGGVGVGR